MATLLHYPLCAFSRSIRLALAECGVEAELAEERPWEWRQEFVALNPAGTLPVFITDEHGPIVGTYAISEYLSDTADERDARLFQPFPGEPAARAEARRLVDWFHRKFHEEVTVLSRRREGVPAFRTAKLLSRHGGDAGRAREFALSFRYIGHLAETRSWLAGDAISFADLAAAAHLSALDYLGEVRWEEHEAAKNWYALLKSRPSFRPLLQDRVAGFTPAGAYADLDF